jgi:DNA-binding transcriptional ArsR family regulator
MPFSRSSIPESDVHFVLSNPRRRETLRYLARNAGRTTVRELSEYIASNETGDVPAPRQARETVYVSLIQTHLPALEEFDIVEYDRTTKEVLVRDASRDFRVYLEVVTRFGITWDEYYRYLGVFGLLVVLIAETGVPAISEIDTLLLASGFLFLFALSMAYQFRFLSTTLVDRANRLRRK